MGGGARPWSPFFGTPGMDLTHLEWPFFTDGHRALAREVVDFASALSEDHADLDSHCVQLVGRLGRMGLLRHSVPAPYGAAPQLDVRSICLIREILAYKEALADFAFVMQGLGSGPISLFGSQAQKQTYLPGVVSGARIAALGMSEPEAGSDVAAMRTNAVADGDAWVLNGVKTWISNAGLAHQYTVFAVTDRSQGVKGLSCFIVEADDPGFAVTERIDVMAPHPIGTLTFTDCRIPRDRLVGELGAGFKIAMSNLDIFRSSVGAAALGFARRALDETLGRTQERQVFGQRLADFQLTQAKIADMATEIDASALLIYRAAWTKDSGAARVTREASMAKMYATEAAQRVTDQAVQLFGGMGVKVGMPVERLFREVRALRIYEGTTEINKLVIAGQTLQRFNAERKDR